MKYAFIALIVVITFVASIIAVYGLEMGRIRTGKKFAIKGPNAKRIGACGLAIALLGLAAIIAMLIHDRR